MTKQLWATLTSRHRGSKETLSGVSKGSGDTSGAGQRRSSGGKKSLVSKSSRGHLLVNKVRWTGEAGNRLI